MAEASPSEKSTEEEEAMGGPALPPSGLGVPPGPTAGDESLARGFFPRDSGGRRQLVCPDCAWLCSVVRRHAWPSVAAAPKDGVGKRETTRPICEV